MRLLLAVMLGSVAALPAAAGTLVVLNKGEATASVIEAGSGRVALTLPTGEGPHEAATSPDGRRVLVTNYGNRGAPGGSLSVLDLAAGRVAATIELGAGTRPHGVQWLADGRRAVVTAEGEKALLVVDVDAGQVLSRIVTGQEIAHMVAVTPDGSRAFVANIGSGNLTAIDLAAQRVLGHVATGKGAEGVDVTPDGREVWVTNREAETVSVVDARSLEVMATLGAPSFPIRVRITPDGTRALVSCARSNDLAVFDVAARREVQRISMKLSAKDTEGRLFGDQFGQSSVPIGVVVRPDGKEAYVAHSGADVVSVLNLADGRIVRALTPGREPDGMSWSPLGPPAAKE
jgi:YVTN family beta-propeller protein